MKALRCDRCGYVQDEELAMGWLRLEPLGVDVQSFSSASLITALGRQRTEAFTPLDWSWHG